MRIDHTLFYIFFDCIYISDYVVRISNDDDLCKIILFYRKNYTKSDALRNCAQSALMRNPSFKNYLSIRRKKIELMHEENNIVQQHQQQNCYGASGLHLYITSLRATELLGNVCIIMLNVVLTVHDRGPACFRVGGQWNRMASGDRRAAWAVPGPPGSSSCTSRCKRPRTPHPILCANTGSRSPGTIELIISLYESETNN